ncbi:Short stature homeobox protein 2 [Coemansia spiralis]|nr:Short stature homeobox protein 2 [Coemansia spiralis]
MTIKGKRKRASPQQLEVLNRVFAATSFPSTEMRNQMARELGMTPRTVQIWFQNKRQASRQRDGHHSRNTKSMATSAANVHSFARQYAKSQSPTDTAALGLHPTLSPSPAVVSRPPSLVPRLPRLAEAIPAAHRAVRPQSWSAQSIATGDARPIQCKPRADTTAAALVPRLAHTRHDQWLVGDTPARLDYLYGHHSSSRVVLVSPHSQPKHAPAYQLAPREPPRPTAMPYGPSRYPLSARPMLPKLSPPAPYPLSRSSSRAASPPRRTMSLMEVLNAPPEHRKLPPLRTIMP